MKTIELDSFTKAYIEAALWSSYDDTDEGEPLENNYSISDIAPETMDKIKADCAKFQADCAGLLEVAECARSTKEEQAGHDFWLTRNGHGCGFWDWTPEECEADLTEAAEHFGEFDLYVGDDGQIWS